MLCSRLTLGAALFTLAMTSVTNAAVLSGPIVNPANDHSYYLLTQDTWTASEAEAVTLGGHLVTVNNAAENAFVVEAFVLNGHVNDPLWIGLTDAAIENLFVWSSGLAAAYTNWHPGEPNNNGNDEDHAAINWHFTYGLTFDHATWNDVPEVAQFFGVVEVVPEPTSLAAITAAGLVAARRRR